MTGRPKTEYQIQCEVMEWTRKNRDRLPALHWFHCSLNGVKLSPGQATKAVKSGLKAGIPDLFFPLPNEDYYGLFIELKRPGGKLSDRQEQCLAYLRHVGYQAVVCYSTREAIEAIEEYIQLLVI